MAKEIEPRVPPEKLSKAQMGAFKASADRREERRQEQRERLGLPRHDQVLRGYKRYWLYDGKTPIPPPAPFADDVAHRLVARTAHMRPIVDEITAKVDLLNPSKRTAERYVQRPTERYVGAVATDQTVKPADMPAYEQGAARMPFHVGDNLQRNFWLKTRIAQIREGHILHFQRHPNIDWSDNDSTPAIVADAVADFGYCLRNDHGLGNRTKMFGEHPELYSGYEGDDRLAPDLLASVQVGMSFARQIEHIGLYAGDGHLEVLEPYTGLLELVGQQQQVRSDYWGKRLAITMETYGEVLPLAEREMDRVLVPLLEELYGPPEEQAA